MLVWQLLPFVSVHIDPQNAVKSAPGCIQNKNTKALITPACSAGILETKNIGLRGIEVADTRISNIDGKQGKLIYRGYDILDLARHSTYEETAYLLLHDQLPDKAELDEFSSKMAEARFIPKQMQKNMGNWRKDADPMDMLQAFVAALAGYYDEEFSNKESSYDRAANLIAKVPTIVASWHRIRNERDLVDPDPPWDMQPISCT